MNLTDRPPLFPTRRSSNLDRIRSGPLRSGQLARTRVQGAPADGAGEQAARVDPLQSAGDRLLQVHGQGLAIAHGRRARRVRRPAGKALAIRSEEHTSELQSLMRISYAVFCLKKKKN